MSFDPSARGWSLGRTLSVWLFCFLSLGILLIRAGAPLVPIFLAGAATLIITLLRHFRRAKNP